MPETLYCSSKLILMSNFESGNQRYSLGIGIPCVKYIASSAPIVLPYRGHLGTFSQIQRVELFQTTTNAYI
jgi:hypothetical protein